MITVNIFNNLNSFIQEEAPHLRVEATRDESTGREWTYYNIVMKPTKYIYTENHPLNVTRELVQDIENFLKNEGIEKLNWNNTYNTFWESR